MANKMYKHVVILGGGFAGPLMAIATHPYASKITLVERFSRGPEEEWLGTPQNEHGHFLTKKGQDLLEKLIPGILKELTARGAHDIDWGRNTIWKNLGGFSPSYDSGVRSLLFSRKLLDRMVFEKAASLDNLNVLKATVEDLEFKDSKIQSVRLGQNQVISDADLVIDARGRTARMREKLQAVVGPIPERSVENNITYYSFSLDHQFDSPAEVQQYICQSDPTLDGIGYFASAVEGNRIIFSISDYYGNSNRPLDAVKNHPLLQGKVLTNPRVFKKLGSVHTQFGKSRNWIENYLIVGDAVCKLNPVFAHGMTTTLEMVMAYQNGLKKNSISTYQLQRQFDKIVRAPWFFVVMDSIRTSKNPSLGVRILRDIIRAMFFTTASNSKIHLTFLRLLQRMDSPLALLSPIFLIRVLGALVVRGSAGLSLNRIQTFFPSLLKLMIK